MKATILVLFLGSIFAYGQDDAGMMAAQQAMQQSIQASQQATQQALQDMQQAAQASQQFSQQAMQDASTLNSGPVFAVTRQPTFFVQMGVVPPGTTVRVKQRLSQEPKGRGAVEPGSTVRIKCITHYAVIYYTTNGWTPTT